MARAAAGLFGDGADVSAPQAKMTIAAALPRNFTQLKSGL